MYAGANVNIGDGKKLTALKLLGEGSFGSVWYMNGVGDGIAMKETISDSEASYKQSLDEALILEKLQHISVGQQNQAKVPIYLGHEGAKLRNGKYRMRLLMTVMQGEPLDKWLHRKGQASSVSQALAESTNFLEQLSATVGLVNKFAQHRDISSHNVIINDHAGLTFNLIDFGLAIQNSEWSHRWTSLSLAGDCKYWPPCAWIMFIYGAGAMQKEECFLRQYRDRLDVYAAGVTLLEFFFRRMPATELLFLRETWNSYWKETSDCWESFYRCFKYKGDWQALRKELIESQAYEKVSNRYMLLLQAIQADDSECSSFLNRCCAMIGIESFPRNFQPEPQQRFIQSRSVIPPPVVSFQQQGWSFQNNKFIKRNN
jgi:serine/threonine protein kinase